ncbi:MAG TPA: hypothetical protein VKG24_25520 [Pseudolabrys sp.]|nr:hypothetical protein [Pseudolabrys sp.]
MNRLPLPPQRLQEAVRWPRHLGHKNLFGIDFGQSDGCAHQCAGGALISARRRVIDANDRSTLLTIGKFRASARDHHLVMFWARLCSDQHSDSHNRATSLRPIMLHQIFAPGDQLPNNEVSAIYATSEGYL